MKDFILTSDDTLGEFAGKFNGLVYANLRGVRMAQGLYHNALADQQFTLLPPTEDPATLLLDGLYVFSQQWIETGGPVVPPILNLGTEADPTAYINGFSPSAQQNGVIFIPLPTECLALGAGEPLYVFVDSPAQGLSHLSLCYFLAYTSIVN